MIYLERKLSFVRQKYRVFSSAILGWLITIPIAMLGWVPFRANSVSDTMVMFGKVLDIPNYLSRTIRENDYLIAFVLLVFATLLYLIDRNKDAIKKYTIIYFFGRVVSYTIMIYLVYIFFRPINQFIYFQF